MYILPVYLGSLQNDRTGSYQRGIYELSDNLHAGVYSQFVDTYLDDRNSIGELLQERRQDEGQQIDLSSYSDSSLVAEMYKQLKELDDALALRAEWDELGKLKLEPINAGQRPREYYSSNERFKLHSSANLTEVGIFHPFFRAYGIAFGSEVLLIVAIDLKITHKANPEHIKQVNDISGLLHYNDIKLYSFSEETPITLNTP